MSDDGRTPPEGWRQRQISVIDVLERNRVNAVAFANKYDWRHMAGDLTALAAVVAESLANAQTAGVTLPWHVAAGSLLAASVIFSKISKSLSEPSPPPVVVAVSDSASLPARTIPSTTVTP